jgi:phospholipase/carboxylesterase
MSHQGLSLHHLVHFPGNAQEPDPGVRYPTVLALHGRGSNEEDLIGLAPHLPDRLLWISPQAPLVLSPGSFEWYRVRVIGKPDAEQVHASLETLHRLVDEILAAYPIDPGRLFLLGFSQGSILSMCYALTHPARIAGIIAQSGYIPDGLNLEVDEAGVRSKPFLLTHGDQDTLIPVEWGRASRDVLHRLGVDLSYHEFPMGHTVSLESLEVISAWLEERL